MASYSIVCAGCATRFEAKSPQAKWCGKTCRQRNARAKRRADDAAKNPATSPLVIRLRTDLEAAGVADSFDGLLALELAERIAKAGPTGFSTMVRELRSLKAAALGEDEPTPPGADEGDEEEPGPDPGTALILAMEARRDSKRADASAAG